MNVSLRWFKDGVLNLSLDFNNSYANGTVFSSVLGSGNTSVGDNWSCALRAFDGSEYSGWGYSSNVTIGNSPPGKVNLSYPANGDEFFTELLPTYNWTNATDPDGDALTYQIQISLNSDMSSPLWDVSGITDNKWSQQEELSFATYYWRVRANDSTDVGTWSDIWNFTVVEYVDISLVNSSISFGTLAISQSDDTTDSSPEPFQIQNDGNVRVNVSVLSTSIWQSSLGQLGTSYFRFKANRTSESPSFSWSTSATSWLNMSGSAQLAIAYLNYSDASDLGAVDLFVKVPADEPPGQRQATITFNAKQS